MLPNIVIVLPVKLSRRSISRPLINTFGMNTITETTHFAALDPLGRRELADLAAGLDLQRGVVDVEAVRKLLADPMQEWVVGTVRPHQMRRQRGLVGTHGPDMQVMHLRDAVKRAEIVPHVR